MSKFLIVVLSLFSIACFGQRDQKFDLGWKIGREEKLSYLTVMSDIDTSSVDIDFQGLFNMLSDSSIRDVPLVKDLFRKLNSSLRNVDLVTTLTNRGQGVIDIVMVANQKKDKLTTDATEQEQNEIVKMMQSMLQGVMVRGSVYESGGIHSFWTKSNQKNLISIFFELPTKPVQVGDSWSLDVNLISNDQNFACDSSYKLNKVTLVETRKVSGESIAVLKYDVIEYVKGNFTMPSFGSNNGSQTETMMKFTHQAIAEFSIDKGCWISYDGIMTLVASGVMTANKKTKFTLIKV